MNVLPSSEMIAVVLGHCSVQTWKQSWWPKSWPLVLVSVFPCSSFEVEMVLLVGKVESFLLKNLKNMKSKDFGCNIY